MTDSEGPKGPSRRDFLKGVGGLAATTALGGARPAWGDSPSESAGGAAEPLNVVLIVADDLGQECLGSYGGSSYETPALDALAEGGTRFDHCYSTPWCGPSRVQLLSGLYPLRNFVRWGHYDARDRTFAHRLAEAGYATAAAGKWQLCNFHEPGMGDHPQRVGFEQSSLWTWWFDDGSGGRVLPKYWGPAMWQNGALRQDVADRYGPDVCVEFLAQFIEANRSRPFLAYYPMLLPHSPFLSTPESGLWVRALAQLPSRPARLRVLARGYFFADYVRYMDRCVERLVSHLDRLGLRERTVILFTSDNGTDATIESAFRGRTVRGGKSSLSDMGIRVPLIANCPGRVPAGRVDEHLVDLSDFVPTLAELAGAPAPKGLDGRSFAPALLGQPGPRREWIFAESIYTEHDGRAIRSRDWKLLDDGRLYDMREDPFEERPILRGRDHREAATARAELLAALADVDAGPPG